LAINKLGGFKSLMSVNQQLYAVLPTFGSISHVGGLEPLYGALLEITRQREERLGGARSRGKGRFVVVTNGLMQTNKRRKSGDKYTGRYQIAKCCM
jgi:hypothetical protein